MFSANCLLIIEVWNKNIKNCCTRSKLSNAYIGVLFLRVANRKYLCKIIWRGTAKFPSCDCLSVRDTPSQRYFSEYLIHIMYSNSKHRHCTATRKSATLLSSSPPFPVSCWILTCGSCSPRRLYMAFSPVSPSMILASSSSPTAWCLSHCLSLPLAYNRKKSPSVMGVYARQFKTYCTLHIHSFLCNDVIVLA